MNAPHICPHCGKRQDGHTALGPGRQTPKPGDISICEGCVQFSYFTAYGLRVPTEAETALLAADPELSRVRGTLQALKFGGFPR